MDHLGLDIGPINAIGGGSNSSIWTQIISDVTGRSLHVVKNPLEAGAVGAALCVAVGLGIYDKIDDVDELIEIERVVEPEGGEQYLRYDTLYHEYRSLYDALKPIYRRLHGAGQWNQP